MSTGFEASFLKLGELSFSGVKVEINVGGRTKTNATELMLPFRQSPISPSPVGLLSWHIRSSTFVGRETEMKALTAWCEHSATLAVRFVVGAGGVGKSRLAAELASDRRKAGWDAGFLDLSRSVYLPNQSKARLLVIDYPEENDEAFQTLLLKLAVTETSGKIRVLCLCRTLARNWVGRLADSRLADFCGEAPMELGSLNIGPAKRLYDTAYEAMAESLGVIPLPVSDEAFHEWLNLDPIHSSPLYLMAAAAHACLEPKDIFIRFGGREAIMALVQRERDRLRRASIAEQLDPEALAQALAVAVLQGGLKWSTLLALSDLTALKGLADHRATLEAVAVRQEGGLSLGAPDVVEACFLSATLAVCQQPGDLIWAAAVTQPTPLARTERLASDAMFVMGGRSPLIKAIVENLDVPDRFRSYIQGIGIRRADTLDSVLLPVVEGMWRRCATMEPDRFVRSGALNNVGLALGDQGRHAEAVRVLERAIKLQKTSSALLSRDWNRELSVKLLPAYALPSADFHRSVRAAQA